MRYCVPVVLALCSASVSFVAAAEPITPAEAAKMVGEEVTVAMTVESSALREGRCFLNSEANFRSDDNFTLFIDHAAMAKFKEAGIDDPSSHFRGKKVHATGKVAKFRDRPQIALAGPDAIKLIDK